MIFEVLCYYSHFKPQISDLSETCYMYNTTCNKLLCSASFKYPFPSDRPLLHTNVSFHYAYVFDLKYFLRKLATLKHVEMKPEEFLLC